MVKQVYLALRKAEIKKNYLTIISRLMVYITNGLRTSKYFTGFDLSSELLTEISSYPMGIHRYLTS